MAGIMGGEASMGRLRALKNLPSTQREHWRGQFMVKWFSGKEGSCPSLGLKFSKLFKLLPTLLPLPPENLSRDSAYMMVLAIAPRSFLVSRVVEDLSLSRCWRETACHRLCFRNLHLCNSQSFVVPSDCRALTSFVPLVLLSFRGIFLVVYWGLS